MSKLRKIDEQLLYACDMKDVKGVEKALFDGANVEVRDYDWTPLMTASHGVGDPVDIVNILIKAGADVNAKGVGTALTWASRCKNTEVVKALIKAGADVNARDEGGSTALILASLWGDAKTVDVLLKAGAKIGMCNYSGYSALCCAFHFHNNADIVDKLIDAGACRNTVAKYDESVLMWAAKNNHIDIVNKLLKLGVNINAKNTGGYTASLYALLNNHREIFELLKNAEKKEKDFLDALKRTAVIGNNKQH